MMQHPDAGSFHPQHAAIPLLDDPISIVIPAYNEQDNIAGIVHESLQTLQHTTRHFEIIVVDDCSTDDTATVLNDLCTEIPQLRVIRNARNIGCHPASMVGYLAAQGDYCYFIPGDGQIPATELSKFLDKAKTEGCDLVYSWRQRRADPPHRLWVSGFYNLILRLFFGIRVHDVDSSELLTRRAITEILPRIRSESAFLTVEMLLEAQRQGLRIGEVVIDHRPRVAGVARGLNFKDISKVPLHFARILLWFWSQKFRSAPPVQTADDSANAR